MKNLQQDAESLIPLKHNEDQRSMFFILLKIIICVVMTNILCVVIINNTKIYFVVICFICCVRARRDNEDKWCCRGSGKGSIPYEDNNTRSRTFVVLFCLSSASDAPTVYYTIPDGLYAFIDSVLALCVVY